MCKSKGTIWRVIHENRTFFDNFTLLDLSVFNIHERVFYAIWKFSHNLSPTGKELIQPKNLSKYFIASSDFETTTNFISPKWHLGTFSTTDFNFLLRKLTFTGSLDFPVPGKFIIAIHLDRYHTSVETTPPTNIHKHTLLFILKMHFQQLA